MCGHVGCIGPITSVEEKIVQQLLIFDSVRGIDSTGIAVVPRNDEVRIAKQVGDPFQLFDTKHYSKALQGLHRGIIGHNRYATQGSVNRRNAHPFEFDTLVGAHNGTLNTKYKLEDASSFTVDSENLFHHINKKGLKDALQYMGGAWALVWWDKVNETMNFLRNKERTLYYSVTEGAKHVFWASEAWMLTSALSRNNVVHSDPIPFTEDMHYAFSVSNTGEVGKARVSHAPSTYTAPVYYPYQGGWNRDKSSNDNSNKKEEDKSKKNGVVHLIANQKNSTHGYSNSKNVRLELLDSSIDANGGRYFSCFDESMPSVQIRFYYNQREITAPDRMLGEQIIADIGSLSSDGKYYKVVQSSVKWEDSPFDMDDDPETLYEGHDGRMLSMSDWVTQYGDCVWCSGAVLPTETHQLTTEGHAVCQHCIDNEEVKQYVKISRSYSA